MRTSTLSMFDITPRYFDACLSPPPPLFLRRVAADFLLTLIRAMLLPMPI